MHVLRTIDWGNCDWSRNAHFSATYQIARGIGKVKQFEVPQLENICLTICVIYTIYKP